MENFWYWFEDLSISIKIGETWLFPFIESIHVIAAVFVLGSIAIVDLRLLGWLVLPQTVSNLIRESIVWTWFAFALALITGVAMFITRASGYVANPAFLWKLVLLVLAGINMLYFHRAVWPQLQQQDKLSSATHLSRSCRVAGFASLSLWLGVMLAGRWIGHIF